MPNKQIENKEAGQLKVQIYGMNNQFAPLISQGNLTVTGLAPVSAINRLIVSGTYNAQVTVLNSILPVSIATPISLSPVNSFSITGAVSLTGFATLAHSSRQIIQSRSVNGGNDFSTDPIDISPYKKFSYYIQDSATNRTNTYNLQLAPFTTSSFITVTTGTTTIIPLVSNIDRVLLSTNQFLRYVRLECDVGTGSNGTITIVFQAQI